MDGINRRENAKGKRQGRRPNYLETIIYCIGTLQFHEKPARITQNDVGRCLESFMNIKNPSIVRANLEWLMNQGLVTRVSTGGVDLGYRLTPRGIVHFAILDCLAIYVLMPTIIKFLIARVRETAEAADEGIKIDLRRTWIENYEFREEMLHTLKQGYHDSISIMPIIIKIIDSSTRFEIMRSGSAERQQGLQSYDILSLIRNALNDSSASMNFQVGDLMMIYRSAMDMCNLTLGIENVGVEALRSYIDDLVRNNTIVATA